MDGEGTAQIRGEEERYLIEDGPAGEGTAPEESGGILSGSALAALRGYSSQNNGKTLASQRPSAPAGPLVAYGSDEESD